MKLGFRRSFERDLRKIRDKSLRARVKTVIEQIEAADSLADIPQLTKLSGRGAFYRIRIGDRRLGVALEGDELVLVRFLHRREIYRVFP